MPYAICFLLFMIGLYCAVVKKNMVKIVIGIMKDEQGIENPEGELYDYRDWDQIRNFANKFVEIMKK